MKYMDALDAVRTRLMAGQTLPDGTRPQYDDDDDFEEDTDAPPPANERASAAVRFRRPILGRISTNSRTGSRLPIVLQLHRFASKG